jgi:hypothetical protein
MSVIQEIRRDPLVADLLLSVFSSAVGSTFLSPEPPDYNQASVLQLLPQIPAMADLIARCRTDHELAGVITPDGLRLLRWVLLSNRTHLISLPASLQLKDFPCTHQFMALLSSPETEEVFSAIKAKTGSCYLWHGSSGDRWHAILRTGLRNATGTNLQQNGGALGPGIYFARAASTSWGYSRATPNRYSQSALGAQLCMISLCEVDKISAKETTITIPRAVRGNVTCKGFLKDHGWAHTLTMEQACVVRFVMLGGSFEKDVIASPPTRIPTLREVLELRAQSAK